MHRDPGRKNQRLPITSPSISISRTPQGLVLGFPLTSKKDACPSLTPARAATCLCRGDPSPMTLRCLEPSGNGAEGTQSHWGTSGSAEEPSPEAARLAKALRELSHTGRERTGRNACEKGAPPQRQGCGCASEAGKQSLPSPPQIREPRGECPYGPGSLECERKVVLGGLRGLGEVRALEGLFGNRLLGRWNFCYFPRPFGGRHSGSDLSRRKCSAPFLSAG